MTEPHDPFGQPDTDPLRERLRAADPASSLAPADPDRVARLLEAAMTEHPEHPERLGRDPAGGGRTRTTWVAAAAAVLVVGGIALAATTGGEDRTDVPTADRDGGGDSVVVLAAPAATPGRCMVPNATALAQQDTAFLGTVEEVTDDTVTLAVDDQYAGEEADRVEVRAPGEDLRLLVGAVDFREDEQYLVSATDGRVTVCGFSGPATPQLHSLYDEAFGG